MRGGEDEAVDLDCELLARAGVVVKQLLADNAELRPGISTALSAIWSRQSYQRVAAAIGSFRPDLVHVHNTWPTWSPSVYDAAADAGVPVVQTLHNYRLMCLNGLFLRDGAPCRDCLNRTVKWPGVVHGCFQGSRVRSAAAAAVAAVHWSRGTWLTKIDRFIALGTFAAGQFAAAGVPHERLTICPPLIRDPLLAAATERRGGLYVGRLSEEKGVRTLVECWKGVPYPLTIIGDGPLESELRASAPANVRLLGRQPRDVVSSAMASSMLLLFPSECFESFGLVPLEAMAHGLAVLASAGGALDDVLEDGLTGVFAPPRDVLAWRSAAERLLADPGRCAALGEAGRALYARSFSVEQVVAHRLAIYRDVLARHG